MQGLSAALLLSAEHLGPGAAWYRQEGSSECSWLRRPQPPELRTNFSSRWPCARNSEFRPSERQQWPGPASARPEVARCGNSQGDYNPLPARHLSSARESSVPGALGTVNPKTTSSLVPPTPDEPLPDALPPPDGEAQSGPPPLTPYQLQAEAEKVEGMGNLECTGGWASRYRVGVREAGHLRSRSPCPKPLAFCVPALHLSADSLLLWRGLNKGPHHMGRLRNAKIHVERAVKVGGDGVVVVASLTSLSYP